jgi:hypothetical protein
MHEHDEDDKTDFWTLIEGEDIVWRIFGCPPPHRIWSRYNPANEYVGGEALNSVYEFLKQVNVLFGKILANRTHQYHNIDTKYLERKIHLCNDQIGV